MSTALEDYGMIGDCETVALLGRTGSIDWAVAPVKQRTDTGPSEMAV